MNTIIQYWCTCGAGVAGLSHENQNLIQPWIKAHKEECEGTEDKTEYMTISFYCLECGQSLIARDDEDLEEQLADHEVGGCFALLDETTEEE